jgi:hypothetical protein
MKNEIIMQTKKEVIAKTKTNFLQKQKQKIYKEERNYDINKNKIKTKERGTALNGTH